MDHHSNSPTSSFKRLRDSSSNKHQQQAAADNNNSSQQLGKTRPIVFEGDDNNSGRRIYFNDHNNHGHDHDDNDGNLLIMVTDCGSESNNKTSDLQTMMHVLKANIGTGVLAMPNAFKNVGLWLGFLLVPIIGSICVHCMHILISSHNRLCDRFNYESLDYDQVAALALAIGPKRTRRYANIAQTVVTSFLMFTQFGFCCVYIMFVIENIQVAMFNLFTVHLSTSSYMLILFPIIGLTSCISNLKHLSIISTIANVLQLAGMSLIFADLFQLHPSPSPLSVATSETVAAAISSNVSTTVDEEQLLHHTAAAGTIVNSVSNDLVAGLPLFFATAVYAFEGIGVVLPLVKEMERPELFPGFNGVLNTSMMLVGLLYMAMGYFGYLKYGQFLNGSITINLPKTTLNEFVRLMFAMAIGLSYGLQFYVPWTIMWPWIDERLFYAYRPRAARDKLDLTSKIREINLTESTIANKQHQQQHDGNSNNSKQSKQQQQASADGGADFLPTSYWLRKRHSLDNQTDQFQNSFGATMATSYTMSTNYNHTTTTMPQHQQQLDDTSRAPLAYHLGTNYRSFDNNSPSNNNNNNNNDDGQQSAAAAAANQSNNQLPVQQPVGKVSFGAGHKVARNRFEDVAANESTSSTRSIPDVKWRPPPRSMRGKRKLVRYTVILLFVALTFVAAALIPRLDLFISLIGALASSSLAIIFPPIIQMTTFWCDDDEHQHDDGAQHRPGRRWRSLFIAKNIFLILFGVLGLITGTFVSVIEIYRTYSVNSNTV